MVMRGMAHRRIGVGATPGQDRGAIDDEVAPADKALLACAAHRRDQEALARRRACAPAPAALLGGAGHPGASLRIGWESTGDGQCGPDHQPVMQVLIR
ncbi:MAG TPA: hypothetical protein VGS80_00535 [Ktedonobacterales bacterium]|nr:hypothetical protein [Ktedonobacterales bacterium]